MGLQERYQEQEQKARLALDLVNECYAEMKVIRAKMLKEGTPDPEGILAIYGPHAAKRSRETLETGRNMSASRRTKMVSTG